MTALEPVELERLRLAVGEELGFAFEGERLEQLGHAARSRQAELGLSGVDAYIERLRTSGSNEEVAKLAELLTVTETFFYRNADQIHAFVEAVLPERARTATRRLRILSAGCASGEEPYSLAIALREALPDIEAWDIEILGIDVNPAMLAKARRAQYTQWSLRATPNAIRARYFKGAGSEFVLDASVSKMVTLRAFNLADADPTFYRSLVCDAIFCRNVIMHFTPEVMRGVVTRLTEALAPGGFLFLGHAETLRGLSHDYHLRHTHNTFYYQRRDGSEPAASIEQRPSQARVELERELLPAAVEGSGSWFEAIQSASRRVAELTSAGTRDSARPHNGAARPLPRALPHVALAPLLGLMQEERFAEARALLDALPADAGKHPDALLFSAVLFTNDGNLGEAERACESLLAADELNAGAHYLKALCREHAGDDAGAAEHDRIAVHLDPTFAMPHLHAGLLAKRTGDALVARRELGQAFMLLEREDAPRLVLFGGGFSRDTLTALCRAELARLGGGPVTLPVSVEALRREFDGSFALPQRETTSDFVHLLAIRVGRQPYALRVSELGGLAADRRVTPVPSPTAALSGLVGLRGELVAVFDLAALLGEAPGNEAPRWLALCGAGSRCAIGFSALEGHLRVPLALLRATPGERQGLVEHVLESEGELRPIASVPRIVRAVSERAGQRPEKGM